MAQPTVGAVIQARMGSSRFPGKVLCDIAGQPLLGRLYQRLAAMQELKHAVVATSVSVADDELSAFCDDNDIPCFRGSEDDVLGRFDEAAAQFDLDVIIRVCADSPLTDPDGIRELLDAFKSRGSRYVHNRHPKGWPVGAGADLIERSALAEAAANATKPDDREHVVPFLNANPARFGMRLVNGRPDWLSPCFHFAIDYAEDLAWFRRVYEQLDCASGANPDIGDVISWIRKTGDEPRRFEWPREYLTWQSAHAS